MEERFPTWKDCAGFVAFLVCALSSHSALAQSEPPDASSSSNGGFRIIETSVTVTAVVSWNTMNHGDVGLGLEEVLDGLSGVLGSNDVRHGS
jgi:hypothetical protein